MKFFKILGKILGFISEVLVAFVALIILLPIVIILGFLCMKDLSNKEKLFGSENSNDDM